MRYYYTWPASAKASVSKEIDNQTCRQIWWPAMGIGPRLAATDVANVIVISTAKVLPIRRPPAKLNTQQRHEEKTHIASLKTKRWIISLFTFKLVRIQKELLAWYDISTIYNHYSQKSPIKENKFKQIELVFHYYNNIVSSHMNMNRTSKTTNKIHSKHKFKKQLVVYSTDHNEVEAFHCAF